MIARRGGQMKTFANLVTWIVVLGFCVPIFFLTGNASWLADE
jgi:hypothetical protein